MELVATIVATPQSGIDGALEARLRNGLPVAATRWLSDGRALDLALDPEATDRQPLGRFAARLAEIVADAPADGLVQPAGLRRKALLIADMDSTMIGQECIDELADEVGLKPAVAAITERAMRGEIAFEPALRERVGLLKSLDVAVIARLLADRITLTPGAAALVATMRRHGAYTALVSGGFTAFAEPVAARLGFDEVQANVLLDEGGRLVGAVAEPILGREAKRERLEALIASRGLERAATLAVGDGANDLAMLGAAGLGVAFHAKPAVAAAADARIDHTDLTTLLYFQGYDDRAILPDQPLSVAPPPVAG